MPKFIDTFLNSIGLSRKGAGLALGESSGVSQFVLQPNHSSVSIEKALEEYQGWSYACIRAISEEVANMNLKVMKMNKDNTAEEIYDHEILDLLNGVNPHMTSFELKYITASHLELTGNAFWLLLGKNGEPVSSVKEKPTAIYPLNPKYLKVKRADLPEFVTGYIYKVGTKETVLETHQVLHMKTPNPNDPYMGIGTIEAIAPWIDIDNFASEYNKQFFLNSARPDAVLESEFATSPENMEYLKKTFEAAYRGVKNAHKTLVLPQKTTLKTTGFNQKDMDFVNMIKDSRDKILAGFRVPRTVLGLTDDVNRANAEATNYVFALRTIKPKMQLITTFLNEFLVPRYGEDIYIDFESPVSEDRATKITEMTAATGNKAVITQNEARELYFGLEALEGGDTIESATGGFMSLGLKKPKMKFKGPAKSRFAKNAESRQAISKTLASVLSEELKAIQVPEKKEVSKDEVEWLAREKRVNPKEKKLKDAIVDFNNEQKARVLSNIESAVKGQKAIKKEDLLDMDFEVKAMIDLTEPLALDIAKDEVGPALVAIGEETSRVVTAPVKTAIERAVGLMADSYNDTTLEILKTKLEKGIVEGLGLRELKDLVGEVYSYSDEVRAISVAMTETYRIANDVVLTTWKESGVVKKIKWYTADADACEFCTPMNGEVISIEENYFDKGDTFTGIDGGVLHLDYDDVTGGSLHPNCRCMIRPEVISIDDEKGQEEADEKDIDSLITDLENA